ncbi:ATP-binding protein [Helicobacter cappadocius]|uniref:ATP-binding protein n=1 Tax=Helicobacter cappadocius TaxID=3063998 RepID=A0AA90PU91_9HELI|nr:MULTISPECIES: ATP-binding protein [unclassified Helicobacter]MDO7253726.1 ATP-binding protein [Helicobacter sp. faydin-H75]MDP2539654.1 ATP-binding protein [Helicobacter sp. faydin-H76]
MKHYVNFIHSKNIKKSTIYPHLKCDELEAEILRYMAEGLMSGNDEFNVLNLIGSVFGAKDVQLLMHLPKIKNLLELGWVVQTGFLSAGMSQIAMLELLNTSIALSPSFLKLLEDGALNLELPEISPYEDHLEYLKDQFLRIDLLQKLGYSFQKLSSASLSRTQYRLKLLEERILSRLKITKTPIQVQVLIKENSLNAKEEIIFFALLKEEYSGGDENLRDMNSLIDLVSEDEYERIKNRALLDEKSNLVEKNLVDYDEMLSPFGGINRTFFIPEEVLEKVMHPNRKKKKPKISLQSLVKEQEIFEILEPKASLDEVVLYPKTRETLQSLLKQVDSNVVARLKEWGIKEKNKGIDARIIFYGPAGTGKTITALGIAKSLKKPVISFDCSKILSMYVGESEKNVRKIFDGYKEIAKKLKNNPILLLDEADQFLSVRVSSGGGAEKMHNQMQNIFLEQIEKFEGILIATTNLLETIDSAFSRRFNYKIEFKKPSIDQRIMLWEKYLPKNAKYAKSETIKTLSLALAEYSLSGGQISLVIKNTAYKVAARENPVFQREDFVEEIKKEQSGSFDGEKNLGFKS